MTPRFQLRQVVATPWSLELMATNGIDPMDLLHRHMSGDWGDLDEEDKQTNEEAVRDGMRILSAYGTDDTKLWIITECGTGA
jgi:hypothetical protein